MNPITIGPLMFSADRFAAIAGLGTLALLAALLGRGDRARLADWGTWAVLVFVIFARLGHVLDHLDSFRTVPWRIAAIWQGGFKPASGVVAMIVFTVIYLRHHGALIARAALAGVAGAGVALAILSQSGALAPVALPQKPFPTLAGDHLIPAQFTGRPVVINLWATWCPPCRREMPMLAEAAAAPDAPVFLFVNQREDADRVTAYLRAAGVTLDPARVLLDHAGEFGRHYTAVGMPVTLFIDHTGALRAAHLGEISRETLQDNLRKLP